MRSSGSISQFLRILCAIALFSVGFAHRVPDVQATEIVAAAIALPDGTVPDLCLAGSRGGIGKDGYSLNRSCEACLISAAMVLPLPAEEAGDRPMPHETVLRPDRARFDAPPVLISKAAPRAPPVA
ncbi:hypothetical protein J5N58_14040 [Rhizobium cremeum]|uniref:hypothetical protein n=1 Tax=Rhizobium cremeum TaxID=2813827 RepID=UPI000DD7D4C0|nr:hypothetical protein [Rhizobium cremeum]MCJ7995302.1 hypothetical protein [Rhizobium cremeum]MCJ8000801.1 hypothetical protein [Rhizobium cremeum]